MPAGREAAQSLTFANTEPTSQMMIDHDMSRGNTIMVMSIQAFHNREES